VSADTPSHPFRDAARQTLRDAGPCCAGWCSVGGTPGAVSVCRMVSCPSRRNATTPKPLARKAPLPPLPRLCGTLSLSRRSSNPHSQRYAGSTGMHPGRTRPRARPARLRRGRTLPLLRTPPLPPPSRLLLARRLAVPLLPPTRSRCRFPSLIHSYQMCGKGALLSSSGTSHQ